MTTADDPRIGDRSVLGQLSMGVLHGPSSREAGDWGDSCAMSLPVGLWLAPMLIKMRGIGNFEGAAGGFAQSGFDLDLMCCRGL